MEHLKKTVEELFKFDRQLMGPGYDSALDYLDHLIGIERVEIKSGTKLETWTVPDEWVVKDAWVKFKGEKIIDYNKEPMSLVVYSLPFKGTVSKKTLMEHLHFSEDVPAAIPYVFKFYEKDWGLCVPKYMVKKAGEQGVVDALEEGDYEVFIDTEFRPGTMKLGIHTIPGKTDREILLFAHLDHAWQANDNLSGVACLLDIRNKIKSDYTIKLVFCPETIGSQAYIATQDLSKVEFVVAVDICGNDEPILLQKTWEAESKINRAFHCAFQIANKSYRKGLFRTCIGSDETVFNDPQIGIPGVLVTTWPYLQYHTNQDTPDKINYEKIQETADLVLKAIEIYGKDFIPKREFKGPLMRSRYGFQSSSKVINLNWDYFFYMMDGKRSLVELCAELETNFDTTYEIIQKIIDDKKISRVDLGQKPVKKTRKQK